MTCDPKRLKIGVLAMEGALLSSMATSGDMLRVAQKLAEIRDPVSPPRFESVLFTADGRDRIACAGGLEIHGLKPAPDDLDVVLIPGVMHGSTQELSAKVDAMRAEARCLRDLHLRGVRLAAVCSGSFLLASTGLLDGHRATTSWWLSAAFRLRFPNVRLQETELLLDEGQVLTAGASSAIQNLLLRLIAAVGGEALAQQTGRMLLVDTERQSQAPWISQALVERPRHSLSEKAEHFLLESLHDDISVGQLAEACGTSERSLLRHFRSHYGMTPQARIQHLRVERAKALLETSHLSFEEIVERCGYSDASSFRKLFKRATTLTPNDYRERFRLRPH